MKRQVVCVALLLLCANMAFSQRSFQHRMLVDLPTAGTLHRGSFAIDLRMFGNGGLLSGVSVGISPRFMLGLSFGGENIIGAGDINWNENPGMMAVMRLIDENFAVPAVTIGFNSQGFGPYSGSVNRYQNKSRGVFAVASKNYAIFHNLGLHGGLNRSLETDDGDEGLNIFIGADLSLSREFRVMLEYDLARNDNRNDDQFGSGEGYLNGGLQWSFSDRLFLQFNLKNLAQNGSNDVRREFKIGYFEYF